MFESCRGHRRTPKQSSAALLLKFSSGHIPICMLPSLTFVRLAANHLGVLWFFIKRLGLGGAGQATKIEQCHAAGTLVYRFKRE